MKEYTFIDENGQTITVEVNIDLIKEFDELCQRLAEVNNKCI